jgi:FKBP-type peptidyl-prolyl cis-trans isomerase
MMLRSFLVVLGLGFLATACIDPLDTEPCMPVHYSVAEVRGDTVVTTTGLRWLEGDPGSGPELEWCQMAAVHYDAYLLDGTLFGSSRDALPLFFTPGWSGLIDGLEQGVVGVRAGGTRRLIIPPDLGYGAAGVRNDQGEFIIPPNSTLVFDIEVVEIDQ